MRPPIPEAEYQKYIKENNIQDTYILKNIIWQVRGLLPERIDIGKDENGNKVFFEETLNSLRNRHYGWSNEATSYNLLLSNGETSTRITKEVFKNLNITYSGRFSKDDIEYFLKYRKNKINVLYGRMKNQRVICVNDDEEYRVVNEFLEKWRKMKNENN